MNQKELLKYIASHLAGILKGDLTTCERNIAEALVVSEWLAWVHDDFCGDEKLTLTKKSRNKLKGTFRMNRT